MHIDHPVRRLSCARLAARRLAPACLATLAIALALCLLTAVATTAAEFSGTDNPNNYECHGHIQPGTPEPGNEEQQVQYQFACDGPITGYQLESQVELTGFAAAPLVTYYLHDEPLTDTFACGGEIPGWAVNCVGATKGRGELITGQFSIGSPVCQEPRVNPLLTVTYAYLEKEVVTQAISGPFELGRPWHCKADAFSKQPRLAPPQLPVQAQVLHCKKHGRKGGGKGVARCRPSRSKPGKHKARAKQT